MGLCGLTLGLHSSGVGDEEGSVVGDKGLLEVERRGGVNVLGVVLRMGKERASVCSRDYRG